MSIRVAVVDDQALVRSGFAVMLGLQDDIEIVAEAGDGAAAIEIARTHRPDVILVDIRMPEMDGLAATKAIVDSADWAVKVLILTTFDPDEYVYKALRAGASGFVLKDISPEDLVAAVRTVADGGALLAPSVVDQPVRGTAVPRLIGRFSSRPAHQPGAGGPRRRRRRIEQHRNRRGPIRRFRNHQVTRLQHPHQTRAQQPRPSGGVRL